MASVYIHTNQHNGKVYVGQTWQIPQRRWLSQNECAQRKVEGCRHLYAAIRRNGWTEFDHQVVSEADSQSALDNLEKVWIILLRADQPQHGYNLRAGGNGGRPTEIARARMSAAAKRRKRTPCSDATKAKISAAQRGIPKPASRAHIDAHKKSAKVLANCRKLGAAHKGKPWSDARRTAQMGDR